MLLIPKWMIFTLFFLAVTGLGLAGFFAYQAFYFGNKCLKYQKIILEYQSRESSSQKHPDRVRDEQQPALCVRPGGSPIRPERGRLPDQPRMALDVLYVRGRDALLCSHG